MLQEIARAVVAPNRQTGVTVVSVERNLDMPRAVARRCSAMGKGRIVAALPPEALEERGTLRRHLAV